MDKLTYRSSQQELKKESNRLMDEQKDRMTMSIFNPGHSILLTLKIKNVKNFNEIICASYILLS